jgi:hypothetical protein
VVGLSGCLLFTGPINEAPVVSIKGPGGVVRGEPANYGVDRVSDDRTSLAELRIEWAEFSASDIGGCDWIRPKDWAAPNQGPMQLDRSAPYTFETDDIAVVCLCVRATDLDGASGQACERIAPVTPTPVAVITDVTGVESSKHRPLCSKVHLSAESSTFFAGDELQFNWTLGFSGDPKGNAIALGPCKDVAAEVADRHVCFSADVPGIYTVSLSVGDTPPHPAGESPSPLKSPSVAYVAIVDEDRPPWLQQTEPDVHAQRILLSRTSDLGRTYDTRTFSVLSAADDCEPFPSPDPSHAAQFVWSVWDATQATPKWAFQATHGSSFPVSQANFPKALPGDTIKIRVEVRDTAVQKLYEAGIKACSSDTIDICCDGGACTGNGDHIRWTTWTVQFQPS